MKMMKLKCSAAVVFLAASATVATAAERPLICFGNEPSWGIALTEPGTARVTLPGEEPSTFRGAATRNEVLRESLWRGSPAAGRDLVVLLREVACSDSMSNAKHPVEARVSLPDGRFLAGCCRDPGPAAAATNTRRLEGVSWRLTSLVGKDPKVLASLSRPATARFDAGRVTGFSGCNNFTGAYTADTGRVTLGQLASTMMACSEPEMSVERAFSAAFSGTLRYAFDGDRLQLTTASGEVLVLEPEPPARIEGVTWTVTGFNNNRHAVIGTLAATPITFSFANGTVSGNAGCNTFRAPYATQGASLKVGPVITTRRACAKEIMAQEREFLAAFESAVTWNIEGGTLDMHRSDKERAIFAKASK